MPLGMARCFYIEFFLCIKFILKINEKRFVYVRSLIVYLYSKTKRNEKFKNSNKKRFQSRYYFNHIRRI